MTAPDAGYTPDPAAEYAKLAEASKSPEDFWLVYRTLMARYDSSCRVAHMTTFADEVAALAVSALAATGRLASADAETLPYAYFDDVVEVELRAHAYPYGAGQPGVGVQLTVQQSGRLPVAIRLPAGPARALALAILAAPATTDTDTDTEESA